MWHLYLSSSFRGLAGTLIRLTHPINSVLGMTSCVKMEIKFVFLCSQMETVILSDLGKLTANN